MNRRADDVSDTVRVRLIGLPVQLHVSTAMHLDALQRELDVLATSEEPPSVPRRLTELVAELRERHGTLGAAHEAAVETAAERGDSTVDLTYDVPVEVADAAEALDSLLDEVDDYCRRGEHLLTLAAAPEVNAYRRWLLGQFVSQIAGEDPVPWERSDEAHAAAAVTSDRAAAVVTSERDLMDPDDVPEGWAVEERESEVVVRPSGELDLQSAPELRDLLLAVRQEHTAVVQLDLSGVSFIDSVGLSMVVSAHQRLAADGARLVVSIPAHLERLFEISGLQQLFEHSS